MNPDQNIQHQPNGLPQPQGEALSANLAKIIPGESPLSVEKASISSELPQVSNPTPTATQAGVAPPRPIVPLPIPPALSSPTQSSSSSSPSTAADADLIEKEWVNRAKAIVERTRSDPSQQNKEISSFKADYIKKRFNKDIKVSEG